MTEIAEFALWFAVAGWIFALLWGFFIVAWRAREMIARYLESKRADRVWQIAGNRLSIILEPRIKEIVAVSMQELAAKMPKIPEGAFNIAPLQEQLRANLEIVQENLLGLLNQKLDEFKSDAAAAIGKKGGLMRDAAKSGDQMAETTAELVASEAQNMDPKELALMKLAAVPVPNHWSPTAKFGAEIARMFAFRKGQEIMAKKASSNATNESQFETGGYKLGV